MSKEIPTKTITVIDIYKVKREVDKLHPGARYYSSGRIDTVKTPEGVLLGTGWTEEEAWVAAFHYEGKK
jgi:hypothetical protein